VGDTPIIGAGNYADDRYGAAACTGYGELAIRASTARSLVLYLKHGMDLEAACRAAFADLDDLGVPPERLLMNLVAIDKAGNMCAVSSIPGRTYVYRRDGMDAYAEVERLVVAPGSSRA
jgi:beta-aspartyl-peptidase (threonine type)